MTKFTAPCKLSSKDCKGLITRSEARSTCFNVAICSFVNTMLSDCTTGKRADNSPDTPDIFTRIQPWTGGDHKCKYHTGYCAVDARLQGINTR